MSASDAPLQVLTAAQTTGAEFHHPGELAFLLLSAHAGGTWKLQVRSPDDEWVDADGDAGIEFRESGYKVWYGDALSRFRLTGGTAGAKAWLVTSERAGVGSLAT